MKLKIITTENNFQKEIELPVQFNEKVRTDLIKRAVLSLQSRRRQPYGAMPEAGKRHSAKLSRRRRDYKSAYGRGISRTPRKTLSRRGTQFNWVGAIAPNTVGGRRAHPPKSFKILEKRINKKERKKAIRSALAATIDTDHVIKRGHIIPDKYPFILDSAFEQIKTTRELKKVLSLLGFEKELERTKKKKVRKGKGKLRGRRYKKKNGILFVVSKECNLMKSAKNIPGVSVVPVKELNAEVLAPGGVCGRATLFTNAAIEILAKEKLFT